VFALFTACLQSVHQLAIFNYLSSVILTFALVIYVLDNAEAGTFEGLKPLF
jgi:hypothetical protein